MHLSSVDHRLGNAAVQDSEFSPFRPEDDVEQLANVNPANAALRI